MTGEDSEDCDVGCLCYLSDLCKFPAYHAKHVTQAWSLARKQHQHHHRRGRVLLLLCNMPWSWPFPRTPPDCGLGSLLNNLYKYLFSLPISISLFLPLSLRVKRCEIQNPLPVISSDSLTGNYGESEGNPFARVRHRIRVPGTCSALLSWFWICISAHLLRHVPGDGVEKPPNRRPLLMNKLRAM